MNLYLKVVYLYNPINFIVNRFVRIIKNLIKMLPLSFGMLQILKAFKHTCYLLNLQRQKLNNILEYGYFVFFC